MLEVEGVVFPTDSPDGAHGGAAISATGGWAAQYLYFQALRAPFSCEESVLCA